MSSNLRASQATYNDNKEYNTKVMKRKGNYRNLISKDRKISAHISAEISDRIREYCSRHNLSVTHFVEDCVLTKLADLEREELNNLPKEMLVELLLAKK